MIVYHKHFTKAEAKNAVRDLWAQGNKCLSDGTHVWVEALCEPNEDWQESEWDEIPGAGFNPVGDQCYYNGVFFGHFGMVAETFEGWYFRTVNLLVWGENWHWDHSNQRWYMDTVTSVLARD